MARACGHSGAGHPTRIGRICEEKEKISAFYQNLPRKKNRTEGGETDGI